MVHYSRFPSANFCHNLTMLEFDSSGHGIGDDAGVWQARHGSGLRRLWLAPPFVFLWQIAPITAISIRAMGSIRAPAWSNQARLCSRAAAFTASARPTLSRAG